MSVVSIYWWPFVAAVLHIFEEFVFPGGFAAWDRKYRPEIAASITPRLHIVVNGLLLLAALGVAIDTPNEYVVAAWLTIAALTGSNAVWHVLGVFRTRSYSPGVITGVLFYLPMMFYGFPYFIRTGQASMGTAFAAFAIGASYHWWARGMHLLRSGRQA